MALMTVDGKLLVVDGKLAQCEEDCCAENVDCTFLCGGPPSICGLKIETPIHTLEMDFGSPLSWSTSSSPGGVYSFHPKAGNANWTLCYWVIISDIPQYFSPPFIQNNSVGFSACGSDWAGNLRYTTVKTFSSDLLRLAIHRNITTGAFEFSFYNPMVFNVQNTGAVTDFTRDAIPRSAGLVLHSSAATLRSATYSGWKTFAVSACENLTINRVITPDAASNTINPTVIPYSFASITATPCGATTRVDFGVNRFQNIQFIGNVAQSFDAAPNISVQLIACDP